MSPELEKKAEIRPPETEAPPQKEDIEARPGVEVELPSDETQEEVVVIEEEKPAPSAAAPPPVQKDPTTVAVEKILEEDLGDLYIKLDPETRKKFRAEGDKLAADLKGMVESFRIKARRVLHQIRDWLKIIPGINKYFLEQEAKIKTDKIMELAEQEKNKSQGMVQ